MYDIQSDDPSSASTALKSAINEQYIKVCLNIMFTVTAVTYVFCKRNKFNHLNTQIDFSTRQFHLASLQ